MNLAGIYIHIPFCYKKCNYCDYYCHENKNYNIDCFVKVVINEIKLVADIYKNKWIFDTIYFGGGSPNLLSCNQLDNILYCIKTNFNVINNFECSIEINPNEVSFENLNSYIQIGINRLSIGFQTLNKSLLNFITRSHNSKDCFKIYQNARKVGFKNINIDMLYSIPGQSINNLLTDLKTIINIEPDHIALYPLEIEKNAPINEQLKSKKNILKISEELELLMIKKSNELLTSSHFIQYEIAHYSKFEKECKHNLHYWKLEPYLGFGPSSHSYDGIKRWWNISSTDKYIDTLSKNQLPIQNFELLNKNQRFNEKIIFGLRTNNGININSIDDNNLIKDLKKNLKKWENFLVFSHNKIQIKSGHYHLADNIIFDVLK